MKPNCIGLLAVISVAVVVLCNSSCAGIGKITRRYTKIVDEKRPEVLLGYIEANGVALDVDTLQPAKKASRNIFSLSDHGQEAYVKAIKEYAKKDGSDYQSILGKNLELGVDNNKGVAHHTVFYKRLNFSLKDNSPYEADRITRLTIKIPLQGKDIVRIVGINQLQTAYATVNIGTINLTNALTTGINASYGLTGGSSSSTTNSDYGTSSNGSGTSATNGTSATPTAGISGSVSNTRTMAETVNLTNRYVALSVGLRGDTLEIYEESITGVNLIGNVFVDVTLEADHPLTRAFAEIGNVFKDSINPTTKIKSRVPVVSKDLPISLQYVEEPNIDTTYEVPYTCTARVRHVVKHDRTITESDDIVSFVEGSVRTGGALNVLSANKVLTRPFQMLDSSRNYAALMIRDNLTMEEMPVFFDDFFQAQNLLRWLKRMDHDKLVPCDLKDGLVVGNVDSNYSLLTTDAQWCIHDFIKKAFVQALR